MQDANAWSTGKDDEIWNCDIRFLSWHLNTDYLQHIDVSGSFLLEDILCCVSFLHDDSVTERGLELLEQILMPHCQ